MSNYAPVIPARSLSWAIFNERRLKHTASKIELKRKLSDTTLKEDSECCTKLRIEEIELDKEELVIENERLGLEKLEDGIDFKEYRKSKKTNNKRIISLGEDLWNEKRKLRKLHEQSGQIAVLSPDTDSAFAAARLRLYKDPKLSRKAISAIQSAMRQDTIRAYASTPAGDEMIDRNFLRCAVTGEYDRAMRIRAVQIVPFGIGEELMAYIFGPGQGLRLNRPDNCLMMHEDVVEAFDNGNIAICPIDPLARPVLRWKVILVNQDTRNQPLIFSTFKTVGELDGKELIFRTEQRPASRFLYYHFLISLLLCRSRENPGWEELWLQYSKAEPWPTLGRYLRKSMLSALARCVGIADEDDVTELFKNHSFYSDSKLDVDEENEIARQIIKDFDEENSYNQRQEDERVEEFEEDE